MECAAIMTTTMMMRRWNYRVSVDDRLMYYIFLCTTKSTRLVFPQLTSNAPDPDSDHRFNLSVLQFKKKKI